MQQESLGINKIHTIGWESLFWMVVSWAIFWMYSQVIGFEIAELIQNSTEVSDGMLLDEIYNNAHKAGLFIGGLIGGAGAGTSIAWVLRKENIIRRKTSYLLLVMGWSVAGGIGFLAYTAVWDITIGGVVCGLIAGTIMAFIFWKENIFRNKLAINVITLSWVLGLTIGWGITSSDFGYIVRFASIWLAAGATMVWILSPYIKVENQNKAFAWIVLGWLIGGIISYLVIRQGINYIESITVDDVGGLMAFGLFILLGFGIGILVGITITILVIKKEKPLDYAQVFLRIAFGIIGIGFIIWIILWSLSELKSEIHRFAYFAIQNAIGGVISWGIMLWVLRKNAIQK